MIDFGQAVTWFEIRPKVFDSSIEYDCFGYDIYDAMTEPVEFTTVLVHHALFED